MGVRHAVPHHQLRLHRGARCWSSTLQRRRAHVGRGEAAGVYYHGETPPAWPPRSRRVRSADRGRRRPRGAARACCRRAARATRSMRRCGTWRPSGAASRPGGSPATPRRARSRTTFTVSAGTPEEVAGLGPRLRERPRHQAQADDRTIPAAACARCGPRGRTSGWGSTPTRRSDARHAGGAAAGARRGARGADRAAGPGRRGRLAGWTGLADRARRRRERAERWPTLPALVGRYDVVNIKLDKCGGLTEGLAMAREARRLGLKVMVGCMSGTSLAIAPAFVLGQLCDLVDLDGPIFLSQGSRAGGGV